MSIRSRYHIIIAIFASLRTCRGGGGSARRRSSFGVGSPDSTSTHHLTFPLIFWLLTIFETRHRLFAELLEQGIRSTLKIPVHLPSLTSLNASALTVLDTSNPRGAGALEVDAMRMLGLNPYQALQHPGFYYYMAARCTERRRQRFLDAVELEVC